MSSIDRAKLEEAIRRARMPSMTSFNVSAGGGAGMMKPVIWLEVDQAEAIAAAAEAHLATLPKTKMVEVWRVEYAHRELEWWAPRARTCSTRALAEDEAQRLRGLPRDEYSCIRVTGPHQQEVPA